ncbi:MAG: hypothetical protein AABW67_00105 [Nanoarchaeota archaeon]
MSLIDKLTQIDGSKEELTQNFQKKYSKLASAGDAWAINQLFSQIKIVPELSDNDLITLYISTAKGYVSPYVLESILEWDKKVHNGKPVVFNKLGDDFSKALQEGYFTLIREDRTNKENFHKLEKLTGIPVSEETINKAFNQRIKDRNLGEYEFNKIKQATGIMPKADEKVVQNLYKNCLRKEKISGQNLFYWEYIAKSTKIMPEEKTAQLAFRYLVNKGKTHDLIRFSEFTGIKPEKNIVQDAYKILAQKNSFSTDYEDLKKISGGIKPNEKTIKLAYKIAVEGNSIWDSYFKSIKELTGVNPPEELVQKAYAKCISKGEFKNYEELYNTFKIEPSKKVREKLAKYLSS